MAWPPSLETLKTDMGVTDTRDDERLQMVLDAAVSFVERARAGEFNFAGDLGSDLPEPNSDLQLGTIRHAGRLHTRRKSPEMVISGGEFGSTRIPSVDPDIERLLGIGRFRGPAFA